jgi:hypothetical protein
VRRFGQLDAQLQTLFRVRESLEQASGAREFRTTADRPREGVEAAARATGGPTPAVPGYEIVAELGRGGMGVVYQARQCSLKRLIALKMVLGGAHAGAAELAALGEGALPALPAALQGRLSVEQRRGIEEILTSLNTAGEPVRQLRAVEMLELIGNDEARRVLETLAKGVSEARLTQEAQTSLKRLAARAGSRP